jgi:hypothetical protein
MPPRSRLSRRRKAAVYVSNREAGVRTMMRDTASNPLYPLNVEQRWVPANALPPWSPPLRDGDGDVRGDGDGDGDGDVRGDGESGESPPSSPVDSPPAESSRWHSAPGERPATSHAALGVIVAGPPSDAGSASSDGSGISSIRRRLFEAMPDIPHDKPRWKSAHDMAAEPQAARRQRQVVARNRRLKRYIKSTAELVVGAAAAGDITGLRQWMAVDDSYCNCEAALPYANSLTAPLLEAAKHGHVECCQLLMRRGARVDDLTGAAPGWSALMEGAAAGNVAIVNALCGFGANPLVANRTGSTALSLAAAQGHAGVTAELLALGGLLPRAVARAAAGLTAVASALDALEPVRKAMAEKDRALWLQGRRCGAAKLASKRAKQAYEKRQANRESRIQSAKHAIAGFMWFAAANLQLRRDFFGWRAVTATHTAEKAQRRDMELQTRYNHAYAEQELALPATASARQDLDEAVETVHRLVATALQRLELAKARAGVVGQMFAHQDTDGLTPVCQGAAALITLLCCLMYHFLMHVTC